MTYIIGALWAALDLLYGWLFFAAFFSVRQSRGKTARFLAAAWAMLTAFGALVADPVSPVLLRLLVMVGMLILLFEEKGQKGLLLLLFSFALSLILENAALYLVGAILDADMTPMHTAYSVTLTAAKAVSILSAVILGYYKNETTHLKSSKWLYLTILLPTVLTFAIAAIFIAGDGSPVGAILVCSVLVLANVAIHYAIRAMERSTAQELDIQLQRQHMEMQTESINALEQNYRLQRKSVHEFEHHLQVLDDLLEDGALNQAREYIRRLRGSRAYRVISVNSRHPVMDVILNQKYQTCLENGIKMQLQVNDLSAVALPTDTLVVILSNLLDNAIEACRRLDGYKEIDCSVLWEDGLYIAIANTSVEVRIAGGRIATSKANKLDHGYGLDSICTLLDRLEAEYTFHYADGWFHFAAEIPEK